MNRHLLVALVGLGTACLAGGQITKSATDVLGAHLNYGRGCNACHSPHSGPPGATEQPGVATAAATPMWGEDVNGLYSKTISTGGGEFVEALPASVSANTPDVAGMLSCLGCHDGNYAPRAMMNNQIYEKLPAGYAAANMIPTLMGSSIMGGDSLDDHPMGLSARINCGGGENWDCVQTQGVIRMNGAKSSQFVSNYGFFILPVAYNNSAVVVCTTCHEPHSMNVVAISGRSISGLPAGVYATMFFLRAPYNPNDSNPMSNQAAQFCRQCHADQSNEMNGSSARTVF